MPDERNKWIDAVTKLIKLTQDGELRWKVAELPKDIRRHPDDLIEAVFSTSYKGKVLRLYKRTYKTRQISASVRISPLSLFGGSEANPQEIVWASQIILEFVSDNGRTLWTFPEVNGLRDLLSAVQYQVAGVKDFLDEILDEP